MAKIPGAFVGGKISAGANLRIIAHQRFGITNTGISPLAICVAANDHKSANQHY